MRQIHLGEKLDGKTLVGPGRQSYFGSCSMVGTTLTGEWEGTDFIACNLTKADLSKMRSYSCAWRRCTLTNFKAPPEIGFLHHEPVAEIMRQGAAALPADTGVHVEALSTRLANPANYQTGWVEVAVWGMNAGMEPMTIVAALRDVFAPYPKLSSRLAELLATTIQGSVREACSGVPYADIVWPAHQSLDTATPRVSVHLDTSTLVLPRELDRYEVGRWIEAQAGPDHWVHVHAYLPSWVAVQILWDGPDDWLLPKRLVGGW